MEAHWAVWHHHKTSPFMTPIAMGGAQIMFERHHMGLMMGGITPQQLPEPSRGPESMQVDDTPSSSEAATSVAAKSTAAPPQQQVGADAHVADPQSRGCRPARSHINAPMRKLSVNLIDTYKLINQVVCKPLKAWVPGGPGWMSCGVCFM